MLAPALALGQSWLAPRDDSLRRLGLAYRLASRQQEVENIEEGRWRWESPERHARTRRIQHRKAGEARWSDPIEATEVRLGKLLLIQTSSGGGGHPVVRIQHAPDDGHQKAAIDPAFRPGPCLPLAAGFPRLVWTQTAPGTWEATDRSVRWSVAVAPDGVPTSAKAVGAAVTAEFRYGGRRTAGEVLLPERCEHRLIGGEVQAGYELVLTQATDRPEPVRLDEVPWDAPGVEVLDERVTPAALYFEGEIPRLKAARNGRLTLEDLLEESRARSANVARRRELARQADERVRARKARERATSIAVAVGAAGLGTFALGFVALRRLRARP